MSNAYITSPGTTGNYLSVAGLPAFTGDDLDIRIRFACDDYGFTGAAETILDNLDGATPAGFRLGKTWSGVAGEPYLTFYDSGGASRSAYAGAALAATDGTVTELRVTYVGATGTVTFYENGVQLGSPTAALGAGLPAGASINVLMVGRTVGNADLWDGGDLYWAEVRDGINGTVISRLDATDVRVGGSGAVPTGTTWIDSADLTWTSTGAGITVTADQTYLDALTKHGDALFNYVLTDDRLSVTDTELVGALNELNGTTGVEYAQARGTYLGVPPAG